MPDSEPVDDASWQWVSRIRVAELIGISVTGFDRFVRPHLPADAILGAGRDVKYHAPKCVKLRIEQKTAEARQRVPDGEDALLGGGDSPALEKYRQMRADQEQIKLGEMRRQVLRRQWLLDSLRPALSGMKSAGDRLAKSFGNAAAEIFNDAVDGLNKSLDVTIEQAGVPDES